MASCAGGRSVVATWCDVAFISITTATFIAPALGLDNGVGRRPPLGWNSWNRFGARLDESVVRSQAAAMVSTGLAAKGYVYLNLDDTWSAFDRNSSGYLEADPEKFKTPMSDLVAEVHGLHLKFGIYTDVGFKTCGKRPGTFGHEVEDAQLFFSWKVDFVKSDSCFTSTNSSYQPADGTRCYNDYLKFAAALNATGRPMVHSIKGPCGHGDQCSPVDSSAIAHMRRAAGDIRNNWLSMLRVLDHAAMVLHASRPGFFADLDILEIGNGGLTETEERAMFTLWCVTKSPLLLGNDLTNITAAFLSTVGNEELLNVNQDILGTPALRVANFSSTTELWAGPLGEARAMGHNFRRNISTNVRVDEYVVVVFNRGDTPANLVIDWKTAGACSHNTCSWDIRDLWAGNTSSAVRQRFSVLVSPHGVVALRLENRTNSR